MISLLLNCSQCSCQERRKERKERDQRRSSSWTSTSLFFSRTLPSLVTLENRVLLYRYIWLLFLLRSRRLPGKRTRKRRRIIWLLLDCKLLYFLRREQIFMDHFSLLVFLCLYLCYTVLVFPPSPSSIGFTSFSKDFILFFIPARLVSTTPLVNRHHHRKTSLSPPSSEK